MPWTAGDRIRRGRDRSFVVSAEDVAALDALDQTDGTGSALERT
jgi:hypothetical protein